MDEDPINNTASAYLLIGEVDDTRQWLITKDNYKVELIDEEIHVYEGITFQVKGIYSGSENIKLSIGGSTVSIDQDDFFQYNNNSIIVICEGIHDFDGELSTTLSFGFLIQIMFNFLILFYKLNLENL